MTASSPVWPGDSRERVAAARVARLATVRPDGAPHVVPVTFALTADGRLVTAVDEKPKSTTALQRLANVEVDPRVSLLVDHYDEDWRQLWWVRLDGIAEILDAAGMAPLVDALAAKYPQYRDAPPPGPVVVVTIGTVRSWSAVTPTARSGRSHTRGSTS